MAVIYKLLFANGMAYIGATGRDIAQRMREHKYDAKTSQQPLYDIWREHGAPQLRVLKQCENDCMEQEERAAVKRHRTLYPHGLNHTTGGVTAAKRTDTAKARVSRSAKSRMTTSEGKAHIAVITAAAAKANRNRVYASIPCSAEKRAKTSATMKGRPWSAERRARYDQKHSTK